MNKRRPKDNILFASLQKGHEANAVIVSVNANHLNRPGSPVWDAAENVAPILAMLLISVVFLFTVNVIVGTAAMVLSVLAYLILIRPWILQRVDRRAVRAATENLHNWELLWKKGGLTVMLKGVSKSRCVSPTGDWRDFAMRHLPQEEVAGAELYKTFKRAMEDSAEEKASPDMNM